MVTPTSRSPFPFFLLKISFMIILMIIIAAAGTTAAATTTSATGGGSSTTAKKLQLLQQQRQGRRRLLVFGDSYADTGNLPKMISPSWRQPYGITFPKKPSGRFSDGRVFTDFFASWMGIKSPVPYKYRTRRSVGKSSNSSGELLPFGMNFAVGGSGVFDTLFLTTNLTAQISNWEEQVSNKDGAGDANVIDDILSFTALVVISGNDYVFYKDNGGTMDGLKSFTPKLINQLKLELNRLVKLGVGKVVVTNLHPVGCLPSFTVDSAYTRCNASLNLAAVYHNNLLEEAVRELNFNYNNTGTTSVVIVVDLFHAFMSVLNQGKKIISAGGSGGKGNMMNILKPCCEGESSGFSCGSVDVKGVKKFKLCRRPESAFYWDSSHPTQAAWNAVFSSLKLTNSYHISATHLPPTIT